MNRIFGPARKMGGASAPPAVIFNPIVPIQTGVFEKSLRG
jgi:hypothetical protein